MLIRAKSRYGLLALATATVVSGAQPAAAQNIFQLLFGSGQPAREGRSAYTPETGNPGQLSGQMYRQPSMNGTLDPSDPRLRQEIIRRRAAAKARKIKRDLAGNGDKATTKNAAIQATPDAPRGSVAYFLKDKTLRAGDVVVTNTGFLVYRGGEHAPADAFAAIDTSRSVKSDRSDLLALQAASRMNTPNLTFVTTPIMRDFVGPRMPEQMDARFVALAGRSASR